MTKHQLTIIETTTKAWTLDECLLEMQEAAAHTRLTMAETFEAAMNLGRAAYRAKAALAAFNKARDKDTKRLGFTAWVENNVHVSIQWVRSCMRAADAMTLLERHPDRDQILESVGMSIEKLAGISGRLSEGQDVLKPMKRGSPAPTLDGSDTELEDQDTIDVEAKVIEPHEDTLAAREQALANAEAALERKRKALADLEQALSDWQAQLEAREAALKAGETVTLPKPADDKPAWPFVDAKAEERKAKKERKAKEAQDAEQALDAATPHVPKAPARKRKAQPNGDASQVM